MAHQDDRSRSGNKEAEDAMSQDSDNKSETEKLEKSKITKHVGIWVTSLQREASIWRGWFTKWRNLGMAITPLPYLFRFVSPSYAAILVGTLVSVLNYGVFEALNEWTDRRGTHRRKKGLTFVGMLCRVLIMVLLNLWLAGGPLNRTGAGVIHLSAATALYFPVLSRIMILKECYALIFGVWLHVRIALGVSLNYATPSNGASGTAVCIAFHEGHLLELGVLLQNMSWMALLLMGVQDIPDTETDEKERRWTWARLLGPENARCMWSVMFFVCSLTKSARVVFGSLHGLDFAAEILVAVLWLAIALVLWWAPCADSSVVQGAVAAFIVSIIAGAISSSAEDWQHQCRPRSGLASMLGH